MTTDRPYRKAMPVAEAVAELRRCSGTQFDPNVVDALLAVVGDPGWQLTVREPARVPASAGRVAFRRHGPGTHARSAADRGHERADRHGPARADRHAGPPAGQAHRRPALPRRGRRPRRRGVQLPARRRRRDEHRRRLRDELVGARLRRLRDGAGPRDAAPRSRGTRRPRCASPTCAGATASRSSPRRARSCARSSTACAERGLEAFAGTELEFIVFKDTYEEAFEKGYRDLKPANQYNVDYSLLGTARVEQLIGRIRREMAAAGLAVESSKGECNDGQHEINFHYGPALRTADEHAIYKTGAKEIAALEGMAITFMAKYDEREGSSCHIHLSLRATAPVRRRRGLRALRRRPARLPARADAASTRRTSTPTSASRTARSPRPRSPGATTTARARCASSATATRCGSSCALPGADVNPYLALAAMIAARRCTGSTPSWSSRSRVDGNAYVADKPHVPTTLHEARDAVRGQRRWRASAFGEEVVAHYLNNARVELDGVRGLRDRLGARTGVRAAVIADAVFAPVQSTTAFEETLERLGTAIKLGLLPPGHAAARRARAVRAARDRALDAAPGADRARAERAPARRARPRRRDVRGRGAAERAARPGGARRLARPLRRAAGGRARRRGARRRARGAGGDRAARRRWSR